MDAPKKRPDLRVGPFLLIDELGSGTHARVFRARYAPETLDRSLGLVENDVVVLKVLRDAGLRDPKIVNVFTREAELLALVDHPSVVKAITRGVTAGRMWTALRYIEGETLATLHVAMLQDQLRCKPEVALGIIADLLAGLSAAQALVDPRGRPMGLVHRDVSPKNVMIDIEGTTKLIDFGTVLLSMKEEPSSSEIVGTPGYLAPEQARGEQLTQGVDVYAVGVLLFELRTGARAFPMDGSTDQAVLDAHAANRRAPWPRGVDIPREVRALVDKATAAEPEARYPDAPALYAAVQALLPDAAATRALVKRIAIDLVRSNPDRPSPLYC